METVEEKLTEQDMPAGLTQAEVNERTAKGLVNHSDISTGKTAKEIVRSNLLTYFNIIFAILAVLVCITGSFRSLTFLPVVIGNTLIGIVQELRAKRTLDQMNLLHAPRSRVVRSGRKQVIPSEELVEGDVIYLSTGNQICADAEVVSGSIQVNESLLTGEADEVEKGLGSELLSGSFVVSGRCYARLTKVGKDSYISRLAAEAKAMGSGEQSEMIRSINQLVKWVGIAIIPIGILLFYQGFFVNHETFRESIISMVAAVVGMIPEGLYLLTTIALTLSTIRLASNQVLLHDMKSIETLARVDVLCVDKTGTITEPTMKVETVIPSRSGEEPIRAQDLENLLYDYIAAVSDDNTTMDALRGYAANLDRREERRKPNDVMPFTSATKYSGVVFDDGTYLLGAPEIILREDYEAVKPEVDPWLQKGKRVLLIGRYTGESFREGLTSLVIPLGFVVLANPIRRNAKQTFSYFKEQGVAVKVISGDNPETVSRVALEAGIEGAECFVDASALDTDEKLRKAMKEYTVFGRVSPKQKQMMVRALQQAGHKVAMTGDGVNDILAMKDADCSVAMASGSEAASSAAQLVLLDSDFAHMPDVVLEGRKVVNNIQRSASLFLVKNIFSLLLSLFSVLLSITYPLEPSHVSLISVFTIGIPGFLLALEPNYKRIEGHFLKNVLLKALPAGLADVIAVGSLVVCGQVFSLPSDDIATASTMLLAVVGFMILAKISEPLDRTKIVILLINILGLAFCGIFLNKLFALSAMSQICVLLMIIFGFAAESLFRYLTRLVEALGSLHLPGRR